jgi:hypothetical protein
MPCSVAILVIQRSDMIVMRALLDGEGFTRGLGGPASGGAKGIRGISEPPCAQA